MAQMIELVTQRTKLIEILPERAKELADTLHQNADEIVLIRKGIVNTDMKIEDGERAAIRYITTANLDRDGEIILPSGGDVKAFRKNPVVLYGHDYHSLPIGKDLWLKLDSKGWLVKTQYATTAFADEVYQLVKEGMLRTSSIGFIPTKALGNPSGASFWWPKGDEGEWEKSIEEVITKWGVPEKEARNASAVIQKWELLEHSDVAVPSNPHAVNVMVGKGFKISERLQEDMENYINSAKLSDMLEYHEVAEFVRDGADIPEQEKIAEQESIDALYAVIDMNEKAIIEDQDNTLPNIDNVAEKSEDCKVQYIRMEQRMAPEDIDLIVSRVVAELTPKTPEPATFTFTQTVTPEPVQDKAPGITAKQAADLMGQLIQQNNTQLLSAINAKIARVTGRLD